MNKSKLIAVLVLLLALTPFVSAQTCTAPPVISGITVSGITTTSATISWTTDCLSDSQVYYGSYLAYEVGSGWSQTGGTLSHSVTLTNLHPSIQNNSLVTLYDSKYWYAVRSRAISDPTKSSISEQDQVVNHFSTSFASNSGSTDFWFTLFGAHHVMQGYDMAVTQISGYNLGMNNYTNGWKIVVSGMPANSTIIWPDVTIYNQVAFSVSSTNVSGDTINGVSPLNSFTVLLHTNQGGTTPAGNYTLTFTATATASTGNVTHSFTWPITVDAATTLATGTPVSYPPITNLSTWQNRMLTYGTEWCTDSTTALDANGLGSWMYDGIKVYQQIRTYTNDSTTWTPCITSHVNAMHTAFINDGYNTGRAWQNVIAQGLYQDYTLYGGSIESAKDILGSPTGNNGLCYNFRWYQGAWSDILSMREAAGAMETHRYCDKLNGVGFSAESALGVDILLGIAEQVYNGNGDSDDLGNGAYQPFMVGLLGNSLIYYYNDGHQSDARIPLAIKALADYLYANAWNKYPQQPNGFFYESHRYYIGFDDTTGGSYLPDLNNLIAPMYAFLFKYTGNSAYQVEGDNLFNNSAAADPAHNADGTLGFYGKTFTQNYRWSFDYVNWRSQVNTGSVTLSPSSYTYSNTIIGSSASTVFTVSNTTAANVSITSQSVTGSGFSLNAANSTCLAGFVLSPTAQCTIEVDFTPTSASTTSGTLTVNASSGTLLSTVTGTGIVTGSVTVTPTSVVFPNTNVGQSASQTFTVLNGMNIDVTVNSESVSGAPFNYSGSSTCGVSTLLHPNQSCTAIATFTPASSATSTGTLTVATTQGSFVENLTGTGVVTGSVTLTPTPFTYPSTLVGSTASNTFTLANGMNISVTLSSQSVSGTGYSLNSSASTCTAGMVLNPTAQCTLVVNFAPTSATTFTGTLTAVTSQGTKTSSLSGLGLVTGNVTISPTFFTYPNTTVGNSSSTTFTIQNGKNINATVSARSVTGTGFSLGSTTCTVSLVLTPNSTCTLTATFTPSSGSTLSGNAQVVTDQGTVTAPLTGTGVVTGAVTLTPTPYVYPNTTVGSSASNTFALFNGTNVNVTLTSQAVTGTGFAVDTTNSTCVAGMTLTPTSQCSLTVKFTPTAATNFSGTLSVVESIGTVNASISGVGTSAAGFNTPLSSLTNPNTSACNSSSLASYCAFAFPGWSDNRTLSVSVLTNPYDAAPLNINKGRFTAGDVHNLTTLNVPIFVHTQFWFTTNGTGTATRDGVSYPYDGSHLKNGETTNNQNYITAMLKDLYDRGFDGILGNWKGGPNTCASPSFNSACTGSTTVNRNTAYLKAIQTMGTTYPTLRFAFVYDSAAFNDSQDCSTADQNQPTCIQGKIDADLDYAAANYFTSPNYLTNGGKPVVLFFISESDYFAQCTSGSPCNLVSGTCTSSSSCWSSIWSGVNSHMSSSVAFVFENSGGFTHAQNSGSFAWTQPENQTNANITVASQLDWTGNTYLDNWYSASASNPTKMAFGPVYKGFDSETASWYYPTGRIIAQQCGQVWLNSFAKANGNTTVDYLQAITWDDYEEGTEIETGIDNCYSAPTLSLAGSVVTITKHPTDATYSTPNTIQSLKLWASQDGTNYALIDTLPTSTPTVDLSTYPQLAIGNYFVRIQQVGMPGIANQISSALSTSSTPTNVPIKQKGHKQRGAIRIR